MTISTPDLSDNFPEETQIVYPVLGQPFRHFGAKTEFFGEIVTIRCPNDNSLVAEQVKTPGKGRVLVVDGNASMQCSLLGDQLAAAAIENAWSGILINGCLRDVELIAAMPIGIMALASVPKKTVKRGMGELDVVLQFANAQFTPGHYLYADQTGIITAARSLLS